VKLLLLFSQCKHIAFTAFMIIFLISTVHAEFVFKKDGTIIEGKIVNDGNTSIILQMPDKKREVIPRKEIMRILYTDIYMGKVYIRLTNGETQEGYIVDEDSTAYTVRKDITKPEEFTINRKIVMFIARSNPTDLIGTAGKNDINIQWNPPFIPGKKYRIYRKTTKEATFTMIAEVEKNRYTIKELKGNTKYTIYVTSLDADGIESLPSDQITLLTLNTPPYAPKEIHIDNINSTNLLRSDIRLTWVASEDIDGFIAEYRISKITPTGDFIQIGTSKLPSYVLKNSDINEKNMIRIIAVDNAGAESDATIFSFSRDKAIETVEKTENNKTATNRSKSSLLSEKSICITTQPGYFYPFSKMGKIYKIGYGPEIGLYANNYLFKNTQLGFITGFLWWTGKTESIKHMIMIPIEATAGYRFTINDALSVTPSLGFGGIYMSTEYTNAAFMTTTKNGFESTVRALVSAEYVQSPSLYFFGGFNYTAIYEKSGIQSFASMHLGAGYRLF
jgi:hypothetical protein